MKSTKTLFHSFLICLFIFNTALYAQENSPELNYAQAGEEQNPDTYAIPGQPIKKEPVKTTAKKTSKTAQEPEEIGSASLFSYNIGGLSVKQSDIVFYFYPNIQETGFLIKDWAGKVNISFDSKMSALICSSFKLYESEFDNKLLKIKNSETAKEYGEGESHYRKGIIGTSAEFFPSTSIGYVFVKNSPYFAITLWPVRGNSARSSDKNDKESELTKTTLLFNKAQARSLVKALSTQKDAANN